MPTGGGQSLKMLHTLLPLTGLIGYGQALLLSQVTSRLDGTALLEIAELGNSVRRRFGLGEPPTVHRSNKMFVNASERIRHK